MPLLVDAYNVLHVVGILPPELAGIDLSELADLIAGSRYRRDSTILVCDGVAKPHQVDAPGIHVKFAGPGIKADDLIIRLVQRSSAPKRLTVVTSDREIARAARRRRAIIISSEAFLDRLAEDQRGPSRKEPARHRRSSDHPADRRQVEHWLRVFGIPADDPDLAIASSRSRRASSRTSKRGSSKVVPPSETGGSSPPPHPGILEAESLAEIDPKQLDRIDMNRLMDDAKRVQKPASDETENRRH